MKLSKLSFVMLLGSALFSQSLYAQENNEQEAPVDPNEHKVSGSVDLGFAFNTGDVKSYDVNHNTNVTHEVGNFKNNYQFDVLYKQTEQEVRDENDEPTGEKEMNTTEQKWFLQAQTNYKFDQIRKNYLFGFFRYEDNRFSNFDYQSSLAGGWGKRWWEDLKTKGFFDAEIGPGVSYDKVTKTGDTNTDFIIRASATFEDTYWEKIRFRQQISADIATESDKNTKIISESQLTTQLIGSLAARFVFRVNYDSEVEDNQENTNTETRLSLVYSF